MDIEKENKEHNQRDQETENKEEQAHNDVAGTQSNDPSKDPKVKRKIKKVDLVYFLILFILLGSIFYMISIIKSEQSQCLKNPFVYGAMKMKEVSCSCTQSTGSCPAQFYFNDTTFSNPPTKCGSGAERIFKNIDWGSLNISVTP